MTKYVIVFLYGILVAGLVWGAWPLVVISGSGILLLRFSYGILLLGVVLDMVASPSLPSGGYIFFYTIVFAFVAVLSAFIRSRIFWKV